MIYKARLYAFGALRALFFAFCAVRDKALALIGILITISLLAVAVSVGTYTLELRDFKSKFVVNLDLARKQMMDELTYLYVQGCRDGTNWTDRPDGPGFNRNNSTYYCSKQLEYRQDYILERTFKLGK